MLIKNILFDRTGISRQRSGNCSRIFIFGQVRLFCPMQEIEAQASGFAADHLCPGGGCAFQQRIIGADNVDEAFECAAQGGVFEGNVDRHVHYHGDGLVNGYDQAEVDGQFGASRQDDVGWGVLDAEAAGVDGDARIGDVGFFAEDDGGVSVEGQVEAGRDGGFDADVGLDAGLVHGGKTGAERHDQLLLEHFVDGEELVGDTEQDSDEDGIGEQGEDAGYGPEGFREGCPVNSNATFCFLRSCFWLGFIYGVVLGLVFWHGLFLWCGSGFAG